MHNQPREPQAYDDCQIKLIQEFGWTSQGNSSFQMRASFVFHLETKVIESGGRGEKFIAQVGMCILSKSNIR